MTSPRRITHVIAGLGIGGAERLLVDLVTVLGAPDFAHEVISLRAPPAKAAASLRGALRQAGATVTTLGLAGPLQGLGAIARLHALITARRPHLVHSWMVHANVLCALAQLRARAPRHRPQKQGATDGGPAPWPLIWGIHHSAPITPGMRPTTAALAALAAPLSYLARHLVYVSPNSAAVHRRAGYAAASARCIPPSTRMQPPSAAARAQARRALRQRLRLPEDAQICGMLGRLDPAKDHPTLIRAARLAAPLHVVLMAPGLEAVPAAFAQQMGPEHRTRLHVPAPPVDPQTFLWGLDIATLASRHEAFGLSILEAVACGTPAVASDVGGLGPLLNDVGEVVRIGDAEALSAAWLRTLSLSPIARQARRQRGLMRVQELHRPEMMAAAYADLYRAIPAYPSAGCRPTASA